MGFIALQRAKLHYVFENIFHVVERLVSEKEAKMNKIFKVIWSKSKQCYVVVSELAKNTTGKKKIVVASIFAAMVAGQAMQVDATSGSFYDTGAIKGAIAIGKAGSTAPQATDENAIAIGQAARANGRGGVALGNDTRSAQNAIAAAWDSQATGKNSVAVGTGTRATGLSSTAVGDGAQATANGAVALGQSTESAGNSVAAGFNAKARSNNTIAIGVEANNDGSITNNASSVSVGVATRARAVGSMAMGVSADASGKYSLALGSGDVSGDYTDGTNHPSASGEKSIAIGHNSNASDESAIAIGSSSISDKTSATALGRNTTATGVNSSAIGAYSIASATDATALGRNANATAGQSTALGTYSVASGQYGTGVGYQANASGANSTAVGVSAKANKDGASAMGPGARAYGNGAISLGYQALSGANIFNSTNGSFNDASADVTNYAKWGDAAIGLRAIASGGNATALGRSATATAANAIAIGGGNGDSATDNKEKTEATGEKSTAIGYNAKAKTGNDLAVGRGVTSSGGAATALGYYATASGNQTVALGSTINSTAQYATGIGYSVNSQGEGSVAIGAGTDALGAIPAKQVQATAKNAIAIGRATQATSQDATAIGTDATASNTDAIAIGRKSNASGSTSIGFGYNTKSTATNTVAIGTDVSATAESAIALGRKTTASALNATAVGPIANASGKYSSAFGMSAAASKENSLALGTNANASLDKSVALGSDSTTATNATSQSSVVIGGKTITWNGAPTVSGTGMQVSVGSAGAERQIKNVAAGEVSANSTDAINGSQLYAVADVLNKANADQSIKYKANGTGSNSVKLSDGLNFTNGTTTTATVGTNGQVSFDLNTTTQKSITDSATAVARTISLGGDTGTTTAKSLTSSNVNFGVKSGSPTYLTTTANGNDVTLTINEQAIKNAAKDASSFKVKANATAAEDVKGGDTVAFNNGDNIAITQTGKTFKIATAKNVTFDTATIGTNTTIGSTGITTNKVTVGTVSIDGTNGINAGNKAITNVGTGIVANSKADNSNVANIGDVKTIANDAVANLSTSLGVTDGTNSGTVNLKNQSLKVVGTGVAKATVNGQTITVDVAKGTIAANATTGALTGTAGVVDANDMATAVNTAITKAVDTAAGTQKLDISAGGTDSSVNLKTQKLTVAGTGAATASLTGQTITVNVAEGTFTNKTDGTTSATAGVAKATDVAAAINNANTVLGNKITAATQSLSTLGDNKFKLTADSTSTTGQALNKSGGLSFKIAGDGDLVSTSATTDTINVTVKKGTLTNAADGSLNVTNSGVVTADNMKSVVNDAITKAVSSAKDGSAWNISTNGGTATKVSGGNTVDLINGDNIEITQDGTDGKKITVKTKKDLTVDSVTAANTVKVGSATNLITLDGATGGVSGNTFTAGNASMNTTGFRLTGGPSMTTAGIDAGNKQITNLASGGTTATNAANIGDINAAISSLTTNLGKNTTIAYKANNAGGQTVSLADGFNFTNGTLTTAEVGASGVVKFNVTQGALSTDTNGTVSAGTAGVATTADVASAVNSAVSTAVNNATGNQKLDISAGGTDSSVNLKTQKLTVAGTGAATASLNGQTITVDVAEGTFTNKSDGTTSATAGVAKAADVASAINNANTALSQKITDATTSLGTLGNNTFTLKADSTDTTAQALNKSGGLAFKVAGDGDLVSTSATTDTVKVTVKKGTLSTNPDGTLNKTTDGVVTADNMKTVVNDAITKAVTSAKDGSAWNISTNGGTATKVSGGNTVDLINGDNIEITQDGTDGKKITVKTKKDLTLDSVTAANTVKVGSGTNLITLDGTTGGVSGNSFTAGNASMNTTGFRVTGGPSVTTAGIDAGGKQITNMISGGTVATNAATIGDVNTKVTTAINDLTSNLTKNTNIAYTANTATPGQTVSLKDGFNFTNGTLTTAEVAANGVVKFNVTQGSLSTDGNGNITNTAGVATTDDVKNAVNTAITKAVDNATGTQKLDISAGGTDSSVNLKTQKLTVAGTGAATATVNGQTITVNVAEGTFTNKSDGTTSATAGVAKATDVAAAINNTNTVLNQKIADATTSLGTLGNNTFTLKADSTDTSAQNLNKSGGLAFKVAGDGDLVSTSATTDAVKVTVKKGTLSTNADGTINKATDGVVTTDNMTTVVNDAITKAVTSAKDGSAWNISTNGGTATKVSGGNTVDLINGDNIEITQDGTDGKKITVKTKKDLTVDSVTAANTVKVGSATNLITLDGATGGVSGNTFTAGNASMNTTGFRLTGGPSVTTTGIDAGNTVITNVASGGTTSTNAANIGDITKAISDLTTNLTKNTSISYTANNDTPVKTVSLKDGFKFTDGTLTTAEVAAGGVVKFNVTQGSLSTDGNGNITNTAGVATTDDVKNAVNTAINKAVTNSSTAVNTLGANTFTLTGDNSTSTTGQALNKNGGLSFKVAGDGNFITTSAATDTVTVSIKQGTFGSNTDGTAKSTTNGVATTNDVANIVNTTVTNAVTKATGSQVLNITDGTNNDSINLKNDTLKVVGADGVTTEVSGKTITVGLDTATKNKINNASTAANRNISLAADSGTTSSQSLKDGDVSFAVKGATGDYISTNMNGSTVEISTKRATIDSNATTGQASVTGNDGLATAKNVADAINAATAKAVSQSAWKLAADGTTGTETISGGDTVNFKAGSNMEVSRTGKDITYKTKDNVAFTTVTAGTGANEVKLDGNTGTVTAKDITATGDVTAKNVTTSGNVTAAGTVKGDTVQGNTVKAGNVTITGGTTNTITGLSNTTWTGSTTTPDRAATEGQLQQAISSATSSATFKFDGDNNSQQTMNLQNGTFKVTGDTMITTNATSAGVGLSLNTNNVKIAYAANGTNGQTTSLASGFNFTNGDHTKATVDSNGVVKYNAQTSTISVANGHATASGNDLATADNVADAINQMTQSNAGNTTQLRQEISKVATETQRVGAHAAAMAALKPIQYDPLAPTQIMAGVGNYRGESAAALGIAHYTNDNTMFNVGVSVGGNHNMINAGVTHKFGISAEKKNIPDRYKAGPISSIYVMQDEMTQLRSENEAYKAKLDKQQSEIDALKAAVDQLLASKA